MKVTFIICCSSMQRNETPEIALAQVLYNIVRKEKHHEKR